MCLSQFFKDGIKPTEQEQREREESGSPLHVEEIFKRGWAGHCSEGQRKVRARRNAGGMVKRT